jgi:hypothetical protein
VAIQGRAEQAAIRVGHARRPRFPAARGLGAADSAKAREVEGLRRRCEMHTAVRHRARWRWAAAVSAALLAAALLVAYQLNTGVHMRSCTVGGHPAKCGLFPVAENPGRPDGK